MKLVFNTLGILVLGLLSFSLKSMELSEQTKRLFGAITSRNAQAAEQAIKDGADLKAHTVQGLTPLKYAQKKLQEAETDNWCYADMSSQVLGVLYQYSNSYP